MKDFDVCNINNGGINWPSSGSVPSANIHNDNLSLFGFGTNAQNTKGISVKKENDYLREEQIINELQQLMKDDNYFKICGEKTLLLILEQIKANNLNATYILDNYRTRNDMLGLLNILKEREDISQPIKDKFNKYFEEKLEQEFGFDRKLERKNIKSEFKSGDYEYISDSYNVIQKDKNLIEVHNLTTNEIKTVDLSKLLEHDVNGLQDAIELKAAIQSLPPEILFLMNDEVSYIINNIICDMTLTIDNDESTNSDQDGCVAFFEQKNKLYESFWSSSAPSTIIHEFAHAVFFDKNGHDTLYDNPQIVKAYEAAVEKFKQDGNEVYDYEKREGYNEHYWTANLSEYGAEVVSAVFAEDYDALNSLEKYSPECFKLVMEHFQNRKVANDKHAPTTVDDFINAIDE